MQQDDDCYTLKGICKLPKTSSDRRLNKVEQSLHTCIKITSSTGLKFKMIPIA